MKHFVKSCDTAFSKIMILFFLLNASGVVFAQDLQYAKDVIRTLCSDDLKGRGYLGNGDKKAAKIISKQFKENGLQPLFPKYFQPFHVDANTFPKAIKLKLGNTRLEPGKDFVINPSSPSVKGTYALRMVKPEDLMYLQQYEMVTGDSGYFLLIDNRQIDEVNAEEKKRITENILQLQNMQFKNMEGILELSSDKLMWGISGNVFANPLITMHHTINTDTLREIDIHLKTRLKENKKTKNIAGIIRGTEYPDSFFVFTAHYDHLGLMGSDTYFPGAHDNASGVAMLLYLAKYFQQHPPKISIIFIAFSAEELGLLGSFYFVNHPPVNLKQIQFLINFDMVGTGDEGIKVVNGSVYQDEFQMLQQINQEYDFLSDVSARGAACNSDHCPFHTHKVPCFFIYTLGESPDYHSIYDKPEALSMIGFEGLARMIIHFVDSY